MTRILLLQTTMEEVAGLSHEDFLMANSLGLFLAAYDTTTVFMGYLFYEIALNKDVQQKLQEST